MKRNKLENSSARGNGVYDKGFHERAFKVVGSPLTKDCLSLLCVFGWDFQAEAATFLDLPVLDAANCTDCKPIGYH
jgi:hypothetical protein